MTKYLTTADLAALLQVPPRTLQDWRRLRRGPAFAHFGNAVRYDQADVTSWIQAQKHAAAVR